MDLTTPTVPSFASFAASYSTTTARGGLCGPQAKSIVPVSPVASLNLTDFGVIAFAALDLVVTKFKPGGVSGRLGGVNEGVVLDDLDPADWAAEVLVHPLRSGHTELVQAYREILLGSVGMTAVPVSAEIAELAATIRANHHSRTPDALQLATAVYSGAAAFITNDRGIPRLGNLEMVFLSAL